MRNRPVIRELILAVMVLALCFSFPVNSVSAKSGTAVKIKVGNKSFKGVFYDNDTANALLKSMQVKFKMHELNGNEKYKYLNKDLPTDEKKVKKVKAGDIMLYGSDCLVVFYKSFNTTNEYTRVGRITDPKGLRKAAGKRSVTVSFSGKKKICLNKKKATLYPGQVKTIKLKGASAKKVKWSTSNKRVASVSGGKIRAKKPGSVTITAKYKNKKYKCKVVVLKKEKTESEAPVKPKETSQAAADPAGTEPSGTEPTGTEPTGTEPAETEKALTMKIGDKRVAVAWEDNESIEALRDLVSEKALTVSMSMYGGFEQVGPLGTSLPRNDAQTTTSAGDIVLYSGNQIVVFYGSNSWAYTRLGHITDLDAAEMTEMLSNGNVTITISLE